MHFISSGAELLKNERTEFKKLKLLLCSDMTQGSIGDMAEMGITESYQVKKQVLASAAEAAEMIVRVDNIVKAAPR